VYPHRLIPQHRERVNYELCAANGTSIDIYGWLPLSLNLGLRRDLTWRIVVADVTQPLIGVDFISHFGLLANCRNNRLLDGVTSSSSPAQPDSSLIHSGKVISTGRQSPRRIPGSHSIRRSSARSAPQHRPPDSDYTRPTSDLPITATGAGPTSYRQSRVPRHAARRPS
jgi:hypothetical protein